MRYVRSSAPYACAYTLSCCEVNTRTRTATPVPEKREVRWRPQNSSTSAHHPSSEPFRGATSYTVYPYKNASIIVKTIYASVYNVEQIVNFFMFQGIKKSNDRLKKSTIRLGAWANRTPDLSQVLFTMYAADYSVWGRFITCPEGRIIPLDQCPIILRRHARLICIMH